MGRFDLLFSVATMRVGAGNSGGNREIAEIRQARPEVGQAPNRRSRWHAPWLPMLAVLCVGLASAEVAYLIHA